ncbi:S53 family peptidase [Kitasatospora nipponensis]
MSHSSYVTLPDSDRVKRPGAKVLGPADPTESMTVSVYLRSDPNTSPPPSVLERAMVPPTLRRPLGREALATADRVADADLDAVRRFADQHGLQVADADPVARRVQLAGTAAQMADAFQVTLARYRFQDAHQQWRTYRGREGAVHVPAELDGIVTGVFGLDNRPLGTSLLSRGSADAVRPADAAGLRGELPDGAFLPTDLDAIYSYPAGTDGSGQTIAVMAFNNMTPPGFHSGGYRLDVLKTYFEQGLGIAAPQISNVVAQGPGNDPGGDDRAADERGDSTGEIMLDLSVVGALAPKAKIVVYFSEFTEQGWVNMMNAIVQDTVNHPSVISCSYGNNEPEPDHGVGSAYSRAALKVIDGLFAQAALRDISICCASGDDGSADQVADHRAHADFPASSPHVLGVGGTRLVVQPPDTIIETVWNGHQQRDATGGGISRWFPLPPWQTNAGIPPSFNPPHAIGRGVPDVSAVADPNTCVLIPSVDGHDFPVVGGTSAAAPQWAALLARINQALGAPVGFLNPLLYTRIPSGTLRDITEGDNGAYFAGKHWDACTGFGSPGGQALLDALAALGAPAPANPVAPAAVAAPTPTPAPVHGHGHAKRRPAKV